jgi:hypothetical protein
MSILFLRKYGKRSNLVDELLRGQGLAPIAHTVHRLTCIGRGWSGEARGTAHHAKRPYSTCLARDKARPRSHGWATYRAQAAGACRMKNKGIELW